MRLLLLIQAAWKLLHMKCVVRDKGKTSFRVCDTFVVPDERQFSAREKLELTFMQIPVDNFYGLYLEN
jgi:hypothetical protein